MLAYKKLYRETHRNERSTYQKQWYEQNKDKERQLVKAWRKNHREQYHELGRRNSFKRRNLGFVPLNIYFKGSEAHHIDKDRVIYIPKNIHQSISHNVWTGKNMDKINQLAWEWIQARR